MLFHTIPNPTMLYYIIRYRTSPYHSILHCTIHTSPYLIIAYKMLFYSIHNPILPYHMIAFYTIPSLTITIRSTSSTEEAVSQGGAAKVAIVDLCKFICWTVWSASLEVFPFSFFLSCGALSLQVCMATIKSTLKLRGLGSSIIRRL